MLPSLVPKRSYTQIFEASQGVLADEMHRTKHRSDSTDSLWTGLVYCHPM